MILPTNSMTFFSTLQFQRRDFLQLLLSENKVDGKQKLTDDDIHASAITFLLAGYETTSNALSYTTYLLAMHPEIQERLYQEVKGVMEGREVCFLILAVEIEKVCC